MFLCLRMKNQGQKFIRMEPRLKNKFLVKIYFPIQINELGHLCQIKMGILTKSKNYLKTKFNRYRVLKNPSLPQSNAPLLF